MLRYLWSLFSTSHQHQTARLIRLGAETDELLIRGRLTPETRRLLQHRRDELEVRIRTAG